jgi:hypothetical protein
MHHITFETLGVNSMIEKNMIIKRIVEKDFLEILIFKVILELQNDIMTLSKVVYKDSWSVLKRYFWSNKKLSTNNTAFVDITLCLDIQINRLGIPRVNSIFMVL